VDHVVRLAVPADIVEVIELLADAAARLRAKGIEQWPERFPETYIRHLVEQGVVYVAVSDEEVNGSFCLQWSDVAFWGTRSDAGFIHHLAVRQSYAGLGRELIAWADQRAAEEGRGFLCLDCWAGNDRLRRYYKELGFHNVGEIGGSEQHPYLASERLWKAVLYERPVGTY